MKKAMKIVIPILLAIALVTCLIWYLFVYDRTFTRDLLLQQARHMEANGHHDAASWFYKQAYNYADHTDEVAIELALQYKLSGNYTKAEYTLSNAIADEPSVALYTALSKTYVEQDKLLDAINMLDHISDPTIREALEAARPQAPTFTPNPGFYSEYINVSVQSEGNALFVNTNGEYPSITKDVYTEPITLEAGETVIYAVAVSESGLVSPLVISGYTVGGVVEDVVFHDAAFEAEVRNLLGVSSNTPLLTNDLWGIQEFTMPEETKTYADLVYLPYLQSLTIKNAVSEELGNIAHLADLQELTITGSNPTEEDIAMIASLQKLQKLTLADCNLSTIENLSAAQGLISLNLQENTIRNIDVIGTMSHLSELNLSHNALMDLSALSSLPELVKLDVSYNSLSSFAPVCSLKNLQQLNVSHNAISTLDSIGNLPQLSQLDVSSNQLTDVSQLSACTELTELNVSENSITDISAFAALTNLNGLYFSRNQVETLPQWENKIDLITIDGSYNKLSDLSILAGMPRLNNVYMDYNEGIESVDVLADCPQLVEVNIFGTKVINASKLTKQGVIVNYDPTQHYQDAMDSASE